MSWFHLSNKDALERIVKTDAPDSPTCLKPWVPAWIKRLKPDDIYREPEKPPRVSISPSVWQCVSAMGRDDGDPSGIVHIYEVCAKDVAEITFGPTSETVISEEHWITDTELDLHSGTIELRRLGWMQIEDVFSKLKENYNPSEVLSRMKSCSETDSIWIVTEEVNDKHWSLNLKGLAQIQEGT